MQSLAGEPARSASLTHVQVPPQRCVQQLPPSSPEQSPVIDHGRNKDTATATVFLSAGLGPRWSRAPTHSRAQPGGGTEPRTAMPSGTSPLLTMARGAGAADSASPRELAEGEPRAAQHPGPCPPLRRGPCQC